MTTTVRAEPEAAAGPGGPERPAYLWFLLAALVANMFAGHFGDLGLPVPVDRGLLAVGLVLLALDPWAWRSTRLRLRPVHAAMAALVALAAASALLHSTLLSSYGLFALADRLVVPFLLFALAPVVFRTPQRRDLLLMVLTGMGLYLGVTAVLEQTGLTAAVFPRYIADPSVGIQYGRARGPFAASEAMGLVLCQCGFAAAVLATRRRRWWRLVATLVVGLCALGVLLTLTRSVWAGTAGGLVLAMLVTPRLRRLLPAVLVAGALAVALLLAAVPALQSAVDERAGTTRSLDDRRNTNDAALRIVEQEPLTGVGWVRFIDVAEDYVRQGDTYPITNVRIEVHNVALGRAAELGLPGALLWLLCVAGGPVHAGLRRVRPTEDPDILGWRLITIGGGLCWFVSTMLSPVPYPLPNYLVFLLAGIALTPYLGDNPGVHRRVTAPAAGR